MDKQTVRPRTGNTPRWVYLLMVGYLLLLFVGTNVIAYVGRVPHERYRSGDMVGGVVDLTSVPLDSVVASVDVWDYFPRELLTPQTIAGREGIVPDSEAAYGTLRMRLLLPPGRTYAFHSPMKEYANRLFVNGEQVALQGLPAADEEEAAPGLMPFVGTFYTGDSGEVEIILQSANYWGNPSTTTQVHVAEGQLLHRARAKEMFDKALGIGVLLAAFVLQLGLFAFHRGRRASLYFALACLVLAAREGLTGAKPLYILMPDMPWEAAIRFEYLSVTVLVVLLLTYIRHFFPGLIHKGVYWGVTALMGGYSLVIVLAHTKTSASTLWMVEYCLAAVVLYLFVRMIMDCRRWAFEEWVAAAGMVVVCLGGVLEMLYHQRIHLGILNATPPLRNAMYTFVVAQMLALFLQMLRTERELSEAREMQQAMAQQNENLLEMDRLRREFLANTSHELKTPLTILSGYAQVSRHSMEESGADVSLRNNMRMISSEADRLAMMVGQLLDVIRIEEDRMEWDTKEADIGQLIDRTIETYYPVLNDNHNTLTSAIEPALPKVEVDEDRIMQVLVNLIANAVKHTRRGMIRITAQREGEDMIAIAVADTGSGIERDRLVNIFDRWTGDSEPRGAEEDPRKKSTGLGLFISKRIVEAHGGHIEIKSEPDKGTTVTFYLPVKR